MRLFFEKDGRPLISQVSEIKGYFRPGQLGFGKLVDTSVDKPIFSITDPARIQGFFEAMWGRSLVVKATHKPKGTLSTSDGLVFIVTMKGNNVRPAYFHGYMSKGYLDLVTPLTDRDSAAVEVPELDAYLRMTFPKASWLR